MVDAFPLDGSVETHGWGVVSFVEGWLLQPDGHEAGEPYRLTAEQLNFVLWFYAVDKRGKFIYRRAVLRRAMGWCRSPFLGVLCLAELCGPVRSGSRVGTQTARPRSVTVPTFLTRVVVSHA